MRAQCCICADLFTSDDASNIAAVQCGHTFHEECLMKWLDTSNTCPSCRKTVNRKHVIKKLYFDRVEEIDGAQPEPELLINQLDNIKLKLRQKEKEKNELKATEDLLRRRVEEAEESKQAVVLMFKEEQSTNSSLRKQLTFYEAQKKSMELKKQEYKIAMKKLEELKNLETILTGCESDAQAVLSQVGEGSNANQQMTKYCSVLKREYDQLKAEKKLLKDELEKSRKALFNKTRSLQDATKELQVVKEQYKHSEEDLKITERKLHKIKRAMKSPASTNASASSSFIEILMEESPAQTVPKLNKFSSSEDNVFENMPKPPNFDAECLGSPDVIGPSPVVKSKFKKPANVDTKPEIEEVKIKITCAAEHPAKKQKREVQDISNITSLGHLNIFKKKPQMGSMFTSVIRKGYDGFGGHTSHTEPQGPPRHVVPKRPQQKAKRVLGPTLKRPPLPTLDGFINLD